MTFDDLPGVSVIGEGTTAIETMTARLLAAIRAAGVPAIGFVNEDKLLVSGDRDPRRVALLRSWLDAGLDLGNHTFSHPDLHRVALSAFEADVVRGEEVTGALLAERGRRLRYFRHPFLHTGRDLETKRALERFLAARGYAIAPVTHDNADWIFARAYANAAARGDSAAQARIADAYVPYMEAKFDYFERQSRALFRREIPQILLVHANALNPPCPSPPRLAAGGGLWLSPPPRPPRGPPPRGPGGPASLGGGGPVAAPGRGAAAGGRPARPRGPGPRPFPSPGGGGGGGVGPRSTTARPGAR